MVLKLYGVSYASGGTGLVAMVLAEKQVPFELVPIDIDNGEQKRPDHVAKNPFGQVPVIDDDGFVLYEGRAICRYLAEKYADQGAPLIPGNLRDKALFEQAASVEYSNFFPQVVKVAMESVIKKDQGLPVDETVLGEELVKLSAVLDEFTLADLFHLCFAPSGIRQGGPDFIAGRGPNVTRWWSEITSRPTWVKLWEEGIKSIGV
ncbi:thioredoxin-like protein [Mycena maculata]|uniref:glutathione transferase n=1 Tax=Mycena maculata TaxID=230809 RepID=A0AAD7MY33_9AGAR|nr:thioredoxin-like protein [Mycena maculata]